MKTYAFKRYGRGANRIANGASDFVVTVDDDAIVTGIAGAGEAAAREILESPRYTTRGSIENLFHAMAMTHEWDEIRPDDACRTEPGDPGQP